MNTFQILYLFVYLLISLVLSVQFYFVLPYEYKFRPRGAVVAVVVCVYLLVNVVFNHYMANTTDPGSPSIHVSVEVYSLLNLQTRTLQIYM